MRQVMRLRHLAVSTEASYVGWVVRFAKFLANRKGHGTSESKMEAFLSSLANSGCSASTQNQAFNALLFFYQRVIGVDLGDVQALRAKSPQMIRTAPDVSGVDRLLRSITDVGGYPTRLIVRLLYGCGLRVSEPLNLRIKDVRIRDSLLIIRGAKGGKDRVVGIPCSLASDLEAQLAIAKSVAKRDSLAGIPVALPTLLHKKYPHLRFSEPWAWLFPSHATCADPRSGEVVRWRVHEVNVQRCVRNASRSLGLDITPHHLRHAFATHSLRSGASIRDLQVVMGHSNIETTANYITAEAERIRSPLDALAKS